MLLETLWAANIGPNCSQQAWEMSWNVWNCRNFKRQVLLPLWSVCACLQHYIALSFLSLQNVTEPFRCLYSPQEANRTDKKEKKGNVHYKCNITVWNLTVLYDFCVIKCPLNYSNFTKEIVNHVLFTPWVMEMLLICRPTQYQRHSVVYTPCCEVFTVLFQSF